MDTQYTGNQISSLRKQLGLTQRELAEKLHVTDKAVSKWERGVNFPDLGLLEALAEVLNTSPANLLGLEQADQTETLSALAEISREQLEEARKDLRLFSWGSVILALLLALGYQLVQRSAVEAYYLLSGLIFALGNISLWFLSKYGEIKKWEPKELGTFLGGLLPVLVILGYHFITGYALPEWLVWLLLAMAVTFAQLHFIQVFRSKPAQLLPLMISLTYILYQLLLAGLQWAEWIPAICCLAVLAVDARRHPGKWRISTKALGLGVCIVLIGAVLLGLLCYPALTKNYIRVNADKLEAYARQQLEAGKDGSYGLWDVTVYKDPGLVQFRTGGSGLAPGSIYEGFYYSASGDHAAFPGFTGESDVWDDTAIFRDPAENSDNYQHSTHIIGPFYWFELHY